MDLTTVKSIYRNTAAYANKEVTLGGWIRTMRVSKNCLLYTSDAADDV